jgi:bifunctional DNA-binding transcriptional regulator/antitoxin component of YhaV-PrlF toxin-antitoxin module
MTGGVVGAVVPSITSVRGSTAPTRPRVPLPLPPIRPTAAPSSLLFGVATIDRDGRLAEAVLIGALDWEVGTRLNIRVRSGLVLVEPDPHAVFRITRRGQVRLPVSVRDWCGLAAGHRVLLTADPAHGRLVVHPPAAVTAMVSHFHTAALGGEVGLPLRRRRRSAIVVATRSVCG